MSELRMALEFAASSLVVYGVVCLILHRISER